MQNRIQTLLEKSQKLGDLVSENNLKEEFSTIKYDDDILEANKLKSAIDEKRENTETNKNLKLGIIGAIKAGKSSFLNALLFNGENVLPKAATPMTAALTILEYKEGVEGVEAVVEYYTKDDIEEIKKSHQNFENSLEKETNKIVEQQKRLEEKKLKNVFKSSKDKTAPNNENSTNDEELRKKALANLKGFPNSYAPWEHYETMKKSGIDPNSLGENETIKASNSDELNQKLKNFVGSKGEFTPFTKSITLRLNEKTLKDMWIIDTPGVNDPVVSREKLTEENLSNCDAVIFISTSGQFLTDSELGLLDRIRKNKGISAIYIIASQVDTQLFGREVSNDLNKALEYIQTTLNKQQKSIFENRLKGEENEGLIELNEKILENEVVLNSAVCVELLKGETKDENAKLVLSNLTEKFPAFFTQSAKKENLEKLANMGEINKILEDIRKNKDEILKKNYNDFIKSKEDSLSEFSLNLQKNLEEKIKAIKNTDIKELEQQRKELENISESIINSSNEAFKQVVDELCKDLENTAKTKIKSFDYDIKGALSDATGLKKEDGIWATIMRWFDETYGYYKAVNANIIQGRLNDICNELRQGLIKEAFKKNCENFETSAKNALKRALAEHIKKGYSSETIIDYIVAKILEKLEFEDGFDPKLSVYNSGELRDEKGRKYCEEVKKFTETMQEEASKKTQESIENLKTELISSNIGEKLTLSFKKDQEDLLANLQDKENSIKKYERILALFLKIK